MGFKVKHVRNGKEILKELDQQHFDLIFMDINMPVLNGFETAQIIREGKAFERFKNTNIPIIAVSANNIEQEQLKKYGINMALTKPFSQKDIMDFIFEYTK